MKEIRRAAEGVSSVRDGQKQTNNTHGERKTDSHARRQTHKGLGGKVEKRVSGRVSQQEIMGGGGR